MILHESVYVTMSAFANLSERLSGESAMAIHFSSRPDTILLAGAPVADCPHVKQPLASCYCRSLTNTTIPLVIYYCREFYTQCPIYNAKPSSDVTGNAQ